MIDFTAEETERSFEIRVGEKRIGRVMVSRWGKCFGFAEDDRPTHGNPHRSVNQAAKAVLESAGFGRRGEAEVKRLKGFASK